MGWLAFLRALLGLAGTVASYLSNKQLLDAGEAKAIAEGLDNANKALQKAYDARSGAVADFDERDGVPDDNDPNLRD